MNVSNESKKPICLGCLKSKSASQNCLAQLFHEDPLCDDCRAQLIPLFHSFKIEELNVQGLYLYDEAFSAWIIQYKECMDEALATIFLFPHWRWVKKIVHRRVLIPAPSSTLKKAERGFDHVRKMFEGQGFIIEDCFIKLTEIKQASKHAKERSQIKQAIQLIQKPSQNKVLLIDDICTTGSTLLAMADCLKAENIECEALVVAFHSFWNNLEKGSKYVKMRQVKQFILNRK